MVGGAFARNFRDNFDEIVCRGTSYRILTSSVQLPIILASFINPMAGGKYYPNLSFLWEYFCQLLTHDVNDLGTYRIDNPSFFSLWGGPTFSGIDRLGDNNSHFRLLLWMTKLVKSMLLCNFCQFLSKLVRTFWNFQTNFEQNSS